MAEASKIEWTDHTFNPWTGCTNISPGCDNCYAEAWSKRSGHVRWGNAPRKRTTADYWKAPRIWNARAARFEAQHGRRQRVFCASPSRRRSTRSCAITRPGRKPCCGRPRRGSGIMPTSPSGSI